MEAVATVLPILLILGLGAALARVGFLDGKLVEGTNRLVFWVGIPCLIVHSLAVAQAPAALAVKVSVAMIATTLAMVPLGLAVAALLGLERRAYGTFIQAAFRGNLAFVGIPVLLYSAGDQRGDLLALAVLVLAPTMLVYNVLAVVVLLASSGSLDRRGLRTLGRELATNPLILSCLAGILTALSPVPLPGPLLKALETVGEIAVPLALLGIGSTMVTTRLEGKVGAALAAALLKVALAPLVALALGWALALDGEGLRLLLVYSACPVASASYIMAAKMGGDRALASASLVLSCVLTAVSLSLVVAFSR